MPAEWRPAYAAQVDALLETRARRLVVTLEYDQSIAEGPPYSVPSGELLSYWPGLSPLESRDDLVNGPPKFRDAGLDEMIETVWASAGA
jgi:thiopurine S-methyltransferase